MEKTRNQPLASREDGRGRGRGRMMLDAAMEHRIRTTLIDLA
jgi:hypothetical protein